MDSLGPFRDGQIIRLNDLLPYRPTYSIPLMVEDIVEYANKYELYGSKNDVIEIDLANASELTTFLYTQTQSQLLDLYKWIHCYNSKNDAKEPIISELLNNNFLCLGSGTVRKVFDLGSWVLKIPYFSKIRTDQGTVENAAELRFYREPVIDMPRIADVLSLQYQDKQGNITQVNLMEKIHIPKFNSDEYHAMKKEIKLKYPYYTHWSFGYNKNGELRVYDFD